MQKFIILLCLAISLNWAQSDYSEQLVQISERVQQKQFSRALKKCQKILQQNPPDWVQNDIYATMGLTQIQLGQLEKALVSFEKAIEKGFNNYIALHRDPQFQKLFKNPHFRKLYQKMRISNADTLELLWLYSEIQAVNHGTNQMVNENINRPDGDYTKIYQTKIPTRVPQSSTILLMREFLRYLQNQQMNRVRQADLKRMNHNIEMDLIHKMRMTKGDNEPSQEKEKQKQISRQQAKERAKQRKKAVALREFHLPAGTSTIPVPCPPLGSLLENVSPQRFTQENKATTATDPDTQANQRVSKQLKSLQKLVGIWEGIGEDIDGTFTTKLKVKPIIKGTFLQLEFDVQFLSGKNQGKSDQSVAMITYSAQTQIFHWYHFFAPGQTLELTGQISTESKILTFNFTDGRPFRVTWTFFDSDHFESILEGENETGKRQVYGKEKFKKKSGLY